MGGSSRTNDVPWWQFWATNRVASKNMPAGEAVAYWVGGGLRFPWIESWNVSSGAFVGANRLQRKP